MRKDHITCSGKYVDCSKYGGYDPTDPCHQTCVEPREDVEDFEKERSDEDDEVTEEDTRRSEINADTDHIIYHGKKIRVECRPLNSGRIDCFEPGSWIGINWPEEKVTAKKKHKNHSRAPNGAYWKFDCNWVQKLIY